MMKDTPMYQAYVKVAPKRDDFPRLLDAILPGITHYELFMSPALVPTVMPFLDGTSAAPVWDGK